MDFFKWKMDPIKEPETPEVGYSIFYKGFDGLYRIKDSSGKVFVLTKEEEKTKE